MIVVGLGRVGGGLAARAATRGLDVVRVDRTTGWDQIDPYRAGPILVCTNADDLEEVVGRTPEARRRDLVFVQNGMLDTFLDAVGCRTNTRGLLYFAVPSRGMDLQPGGTSVFAGEHAGSVSAWLLSLDLAAGVVERDAFSAQMANKLIWNCTFGLLCEAHDTTVGQVCTNHLEDVQGLCSELCRVVNTALGTQLQSATIAQDLVAYSMSISDYRGSLKQWPWRNGWFVEEARNRGIDCPVHDKFLVGRTPKGR